MQQVRSSIEISSDIAAVMERASPNLYFSEEHLENTEYVNNVLLGRRLVTPKAFLSLIRRQAREAGLSAEMNPLVNEARRILNRSAPQKQAPSCKTGPVR